MGKKVIIMMLVIAASILLSGCCCCSNLSASPSVRPDNGDWYGTLTVTETPYTATSADIAAGNKAVSDAAAAIDANDDDAFTALMSQDTLSRVHGSPDLTGPEAKGLAKGLKNARIVMEKPDAFTYETTVNGVDIMFLVIKEDGAWKLSGL